MWRQHDHHGYLSRQYNLRRIHNREINKIKSTKNIKSHSRSSMDSLLTPKPNKESKEIFVCETNDCNKCFKSRLSLKCRKRYHTRSDHKSCVRTQPVSADHNERVRNNQRRYECVFKGCAKTFKRVCSLKFHLHYVHFTEDLAEDKDLKDIISQMKGQSLTPMFVCVVCSAQFKYHRCWDKHMDDHFKWFLAEHLGFGSHIIGPLGSCIGSECDIC